MKKSIFLFAVAALFASCNDDDDNTANVQQESDAVKKLVTVSYRDALASSNPDNITDVFTADGIVMGPGSPTANGTAQLNSTYQGIFGAVALDLNFKIDEIILGNNYAFVRSTSAGTVTVNGSGASAPEENREVFIAKKENNQWKLARYIYNKMGVLSQAASTQVIQNNAIAYNEQDNAAIRSLITNTYASALNASDAAAISNAFITDGVLMAPDAPTMVGTAAIKATYESVFSSLALNLAFTIDEIVIDGEYGYVRSHSNGTVTIGGQQLPANYREIFIVKKVDSQWKLTWYEYNQPN
jgi:uncharacterized protein (TIGR02246 family)